MPGPTTNQEMGKPGHLREVSIVILSCHEISSTDKRRNGQRSLIYRSSWAQETGWNCVRKGRIDSRIFAMITSKPENSEDLNLIPEPKTPGGEAPQKSPSCSPLMETAVPNSIPIAPSIPESIALFKASHWYFSLIGLSPARDARRKI